MNDLHNRRTFLRAAAVAGAAWVTADLGQVEEALAWAGHQTGKADATLTVLTRAQADVLDALASRILPSLDGRPGAREAGAVYFIDQHDITKNRSGLEVEIAFPWVEYGGSHHITGHEVGRKLYPGKFYINYFSNQLCREGFCNARHALYQNMSIT